MIGIIGGSGLYEIEGVAIREHKKILTPFGDPSDAYLIGEFSGSTVVFLPRHGPRHSIPPHKINYRANIRGFKELGVERIISVGAVGGIEENPSGGLECLCRRRLVFEQVLQVGPVGRGLGFGLLAR